MIDLDTTAQRLRSQVPDLLLVAGAASFDLAVASGPAAYPAAYVMPAQEKAGPSAGFGLVAQQVRVGFSVALAVQYVQDASGDGVAARIEALRRQVFAALLGWEPSDANGPVVFDSGRWVTLHNGFFWWQDEFACDQFLRSV